MEKLIILMSFLLIVLPLTSYAVTQPSLDKAMEEAAISGRPVEQKGEDGMIYKAFPDYGKSKCRIVYGSVWQEGKVIDRKIKEVCNKDFKLLVPYVPHHIGK